MVATVQEHTEVVVVLPAIPIDAVSVDVVLRGSGTCSLVCLD